MSTSSVPGSLTSRGLSVLRNMGAWVAINPDQTYVATSIPGLGVCKSVYCEAERREVPKARGKPATRGTLAPLLFVSMAAIGFLTSCASYRPLVDTLDVSDRGQNERCLADCQNYAEPVSPGAWAIADVLSGVAPGAAARDRTGLLDTAGSGVLEAAMVGGACADGRIVRKFIGGQGCVVLG